MLWVAVTFDVAAASIDCPDRVRDLAPDQFVIGIARPKCNVSLAFRKIEIAVAHHKFDAQLGIAGVKALNEGHHPVHDRFRTSHPDNAAAIAPPIGDTPLEIPNHDFYTLSIGL